MTWDETRSEHSDFGLPEKRCRHKFICNARGRDCTQRPVACHSANPRAGNFTLPCNCTRDTHASRGTGSYVDTSQRDRMSEGKKGSIHVGMKKDRKKRNGKKRVAMIWTFRSSKPGRGKRVSLLHKGTLPVLGPTKPLTEWVSGSSPRETLE